MKSLEKYKVILWDFDGVLMDSMPVRELGFAEVLAEFPKEQLAQLISYHRANGGLSRYNKFRYFFETIRKEQITESRILQLSEQFSLIMKEKLLDNSLLIKESLNFVRLNPYKQIMRIVSGSDQEELRFLCSQMGISVYFENIWGSPTPKIQLVKEQIQEWDGEETEFIFIGDSLNDWEASDLNGIDFAGYNNPDLKGLGSLYIDKF